MEQQNHSSGMGMISADPGSLQGKCGRHTTGFFKKPHDLRILNIREIPYIKEHIA
jgi:hypothetical protein